jgi:histidinol-phosphatase (PHP family)
MKRRKWGSDKLWDQQEKSKNILTDYHMHSTFSPDANTSLNQMCLHAIQIGFKEIAFTEHVEWHPDWHGSLDVEAYLSAVRMAKERYARKGLEIYAGVEVGNPHDYPDQASDIFLNPEFDVIIASLHWLRGVNIHLVDCFIGRDPVDVFVEYFLEIRRMSECCDFDILAHFDRIFFAGWKLGLLPDLGQLESVIRSAFAVMAEHGQVLELNTKLYGLMPSVWKDIMVTAITWFKEEGGTRISIGSDAHKLFEIGRHFEIAEEILESTQFEVILPGAFTKSREKSITC